MDVDEYKFIKQPKRNIHFFRKLVLSLYLLSITLYIDIGLYRIALILSILFVAHIFYTITLYYERLLEERKNEEKIY
ncbi:MAG: hypothetical protein PF513_04840 [Tenericutes bacterium]|jgi:hypothetical protein|nr:hypothetical protein [Mycoplasmatota bacterium]